MNRSLPEVYLSALGYPLKEVEHERAVTKELSPREFATWQTNKKQVILEFHFQYNDLFRELCKNKLPDSWENVPITTKADFQRPLEQLLSTGFSRSTVYVSNTSGSSGHPFFFAKDKFTHALSWINIKELYKNSGISLSDRQGRFYGIPLDFPGNYLEWLKDRLMNRIRFAVHDLSDDRLRWILRTIRKKKINYLYGYTSAIVIFARFLLDQKIVLRDHSPFCKACIVTAEVATPEDLNLLREAFGIKIIVEYGSSELGVMGFDNGDGEMVASDDLFFEEWTNPDGLTELLCTSLYNKAYPFIRYRIGDMGELKKRDERVIIEKLLGRTNDTVRLPSGRIAAGLTFYYISRSIIETPGSLLKEFIIRQTSLNTFEFDIVAGRKLNLEDERLIREKTELYLEKGLDLKFNYMTRIERPASGKIKHFYSELP